jgi:5,10-methylene-tetrahydrofolate dehydrogenase/methenyl tetrahydrofolate cyclohydrolase
MEILLDFRSNPSSKTLYIRIKDNLKARGVTFEGNNIDLNEAITEEEFVDEMMTINDQKYDV